MQPSLSALPAAFRRCEAAHLLPVEDDDAPSEAETGSRGSPAASNPDVSTRAARSRLVCVRARVRARARERVRAPESEGERESDCCMNDVVAGAGVA